MADAGPRVIADPALFRAACDGARGAGLKIAFVPTMGALHEGHLALVDEARRRGDVVAVSIFVNPAQFGPKEDFDKYPRTLEADVAKLAARGVELVLAPEASSMYAPGHATAVRVEGLTRGLCGGKRPGHFEGVATIVLKLFNIVGPCTAVFGRKDYQQLKVIERMACDLDVPVTIIGHPTVREQGGLAMSSRNAYLSAAERDRALLLSAGLRAAHGMWARGERMIGALRRAVVASVDKAADSVDYVTAADPDTLAELLDSTVAEDRLLLAVAARVGKTRLIDNTVLGEDAPPGGEPA
ncbi:MAG: pantoate--beta-alanine ligase [Deltaproteobacteria bacterium]|nr:pantoate--beta-alanine ligase [Deltaproteobacteria bacterium]